MGLMGAVKLPLKLIQIMVWFFLFIHSKGKLGMGLGQGLDATKAGEGLTDVLPKGVSIRGWTT